MRFQTFVKFINKKIKSFLPGAVKITKHPEPFDNSQKIKLITPGDDDIQVLNKKEFLMAQESAIKKGKFFGIHNALTGEVTFFMEYHNDWYGGNLEAIKLEDQDYMITIFKVHFKQCMHCGCYFGDGI